MKKFGVLIWFASVAALIVFAVKGFGSLVDPLGTRFDLNGNVLQTGSKLSSALTLGILFSFVEVIIFGLYAGLERLPVSMISLPDRDYWFRTLENQQRAYSKLRSLLAGLGIWITLTGFVVLNTLFSSNRSPDALAMPTGVPIALVILSFVIFTAWPFTLLQKPSTEQ